MINQVAVYQDAVHRDAVHRAAVSQVAVLPEQELAADQQGFTPEDILWALGIWSAILCLSPVIVFYVLMVA